MTDVEQSGIETGAFQLRNGSVGLSLRFSPEALAALTSEIGAGFMSIPRRGAEVGGVLAGKMTQQSSEWVVSVDRISPVPIRYEYGPSWRLSAGEKQEFQQVVNKGRQSSSLIGWYRSNTRPEHEAEEADRQISRSFFGSQSIFLFCQPSADGQIHAACIIMLPHGVEVAFPFDLGKFSRLDALFHSRDQDTEPASILAPPASSSRASLALASAAPVPARSAPIYRKARVAAAVLVTIGATWYARARVFTPATASASTRLASPAPAPAPAPRLPLGLRADYQKDSLLIGWDRTAPEVASAASATFRISDAGRTRTLNLSARELQTGSIVYKPKADEISVEMDVTSREGATASQSIRIVGAAVQSRSTDAFTKPVAQDTRQSASPRPFQPPPDPSPAQQRDITTPDLPPIDAALTANQTKLLAGGLPSFSGRLPGFIEKRREFHAPEPVRWRHPVLPASVRLPDYAYDRPLQIQVEVTVGIDGRVIAARLTGESGPYAGLLGPSALNAAQTWKFRPATLGGQPIQSTMVLTFRYDRPR